MIRVLMSVGKAVGSGKKVSWFTPCWSSSSNDRDKRIKGGSQLVVGSLGIASRKGANGLGQTHLDEGATIVLQKTACHHEKYT